MTQPSDMRADTTPAIIGEIEPGILFELQSFPVWSVAGGTPRAVAMQAAREAAEWLADVLRCIRGEPA